jgi:8-oxo-dGTP diphosphatase
MDSKITQVYGNKVRVRACGLCWQKSALLMVNHKGLTEGDFWAPPGGGVEFGDSIEETIVKEFKEETGLIVKPGAFIFGCEFIQHPLHSIELFYEVQMAGGKLTTGEDPEVQIIDAVRFFEFDAIKKLSEDAVHGIFKVVNTISELRNLKGFYKI